MKTRHRYVIVGAGRAAASAVEGIRQVETAGPILMIGAEAMLPYERPPLSKQLWFGKKKPAEIFPHSLEWYQSQGVELLLGRRATGLDATARKLIDDRGGEHEYDKLLLATGGAPRTLAIPGGELPGVSYYRTLADYTALQEMAPRGKTATVIGGGFIGSELAAALTHAGAQVTMLFPGRYLAQRVFPEPFAQLVTQQFRERGIRVLGGDVPTSIVHKGNRFLTNTRDGEQLPSDMVVVGVGIRPSTELAAAAGLTIADGVAVNALLQSSSPEVYAAGDNAEFPYAALGRWMRVEHWDNALSQGRQAGRNMAGAGEKYLHLPYFFSDLFELGYEAVGDVNSRLETFADWQVEGRKGVLYYLANGRVRGAMMVDVWDKVEQARELIRRGEPVSPQALRGAIR